MIFSLKFITKEGSDNQTQNYKQNSIQLI